MIVKQAEHAFQSDYLSFSSSPTSCFDFYFNCIQTNEPANPFESIYISIVISDDDSHVHKQAKRDTLTKQKWKQRSFLIISQKDADTNITEIQRERAIVKTKRSHYINKIFNHPHSSQNGNQKGQGTR